jgi:two-component system NtrC family sensor kinase
MKKFLLLFSWLFVFAHVNAQNNLPPVYEITTDTAVTTLPERYWQILEDKEGDLSFDQVSRSPISDHFHANTVNNQHFDHSIHSYWFRFILKNTTGQTAKICVDDTLNQIIEKSDFYFIAPNGIITHKANDLLTPWSQLSGLKRFQFIPIELEAGEELVVYHRLFHRGGFSAFWVGFHPTEKVMQHVYLDSDINYLNGIHDSFIFGVLAFASLFFLFFFIIVKEKVYLYFSLYLMALGIGRFNTNQEMYDVFFREYPSFYNSIVVFIWFFPVFFLVCFTRHLLNTKHYLPRWDKFLYGFNFFYALSYLLFLILRISGRDPEAMQQWITLYEGMLLALCVPITFMLSLKWFKSNKVLTWIVLPIQSTWSVFMVISWLSRVYLFKTGVTPVDWLVTKWYLFETILLSCLVIAFSWILLHRFVDLKKQIVQKELEKEIERSRLIEKQKGELEEQVTKRTSELNQSLTDLKSTQAQLIQSEKMASLGELTAGIAHEIQNPLNFVNNFSEVNGELIDELQTELKSGKTGEALSISNNIKENEQKISHHGKRADAIVKGMLQHSRSGTGIKALTDINTLAGEYLRLSYHGLRAKEKSFHATMNTDYDRSIDNIPIVPQDIGRVLLNLYNNAFYAVSEKKLQIPEGYEPAVSVITRKLNGGVEIRVNDNGNGIPHKLIDKIFQPFFTTKPAGEGTGLGLSLSYDIIKAHGGEIKVDTKEGEFTEFSILLPG